MFSSGSPESLESSDGLFRQSGEMAALMRDFDWASTPLGPPGLWPEPLRTFVQLILSSSQPMYLAWTHDLIALYNDAYRPILGQDKHPWALGARTAEIFGQDGYPGLKPVFDAALERGHSAAYVDLLVPLVRQGYMEECYFNVGWTPLHMGQGIGGVLCLANETTARVLAARRTKTLAALTARLLEPADPEGCSRTALSIADDNPQDLPFVLLYLPQPDGTLLLSGHAGLEQGQAEVWHQPPEHWTAQVALS